MRNSSRPSHIVQHQEETNHSIDFDNTKILYRSEIWDQRLFLESWSTNERTLNRAIELNDVYTALRN